ncbi:MAG: YibE/F family protein, partial [Clostridia bacterium]|nr:YibE/F family protein [Clostridia bacterium]
IPALKMLNLDMIATEIIRAMAGSIGLILAIPITALVAGFLMTGQGLDERAVEVRAHRRG